MRTAPIKPTVIAVTGHPATGKTTLAHKLADALGLPLVWKDGIKETLLDILGSSTVEWSRKLSVATWGLVYQQVEGLLRAQVSHIVESNFDPTYANAHWRALKRQYEFELVQIRCDTAADVLLRRYIQRIELGERHVGHVDVSKDVAFLRSIEQPMGWIGVESSRMSLNTTDYALIDYATICEDVRQLLVKATQVCVAMCKGG